MNAGTRRGGGEILQRNWYPVKNPCPAYNYPKNPSHDKPGTPGEHDTPVKALHG